MNVCVCARENVVRVCAFDVTRGFSLTRKYVLYGDDDDDGDDGNEVRKTMILRSATARN